MDYKHVVIDASSFLLFEVTGDSESDFGSGNKISIADDDAESCSCDSHGNIDEFNDGDDQGSKKDDDGNYCVVNQEWAVQKMGLPDTELEFAPVEQEKDYTVGVNSNMELMNEMEKNRLFWETCLAN